MDYKNLKIALFVSIFTALLPTLIALIIIRVKQINVMKRFLYSYLCAYILGFGYTSFCLFTKNRASLNDLGITMLLHLIGAFSIMIFLKIKHPNIIIEKKDKVIKNNNKIKIKRDFSKLTEQMNNYSFLDFLKQYGNKYHIILFFIIGTITIIGQSFIKIDLTSGFNFSDFYKTFYLIFFLNSLPWLILFYIGFVIRKKIEIEKIIKLIDYLVAVIIGGLFISLSFLPILMLIMIIALHLNLFQPNSFINPSYLSIIFIPLMFLFTFYGIGALTCILLKMEPTFNIKKTFFVFQKPFVQFLLKWSLLFLILPLTIPFITYKLINISSWIKFISYYFSITSTLIVTLLTLYFVKLFKIENFDL